jgi:hypothetical protein
VELGELVYTDHDQSGRLIAAAEYLSGNVRLKLEQARAAAAGDTSLEVNVAALERVLPADLTGRDRRSSHPTGPTARAVRRLTGRRLTLSVGFRRLVVGTPGMRRLRSATARSASVCSGPGDCRQAELRAAVRTATSGPWLISADE